MPHRGFDILTVHAYDYAMNNLIVVHYDCLPPIPVPHPRKTPKVERNQKIKEQFACGYTMAELAQHFEVSEQRIHQIIHSARRARRMMCTPAIASIRSLSVRCA
jgi:hypothetical protein